MIGWLDCAAGASGDMFLGALVDAGVPLPVLERAVDAVAPQAVTLRAERVTRAGFAALHVRVETAESAVRRTWADVRDLLDAAALEPTVGERALSTFARLAEAEAAVHAVAPDDVHFHEVGALDAIADVVAACAGLDHLGLQALSASPVALGAGTARTAHGPVSVPPPAVVALLQGTPTYGGAETAELCTPTGAALLREWVTEWGAAQPAMTVSRTGTGAGARDLPARPNVLRLLVGEAAEAGPHRDETQLVLETNVDDLDPRLWPAVLARLLAVGAADAWLTPIVMKKGRPAHTLSVLTPVERANAVRDVVFAETSAIGLRESVVAKHALERVERTVAVTGGPVRVKLAHRGGRVVNVQPEYDDVVAAAASAGRPVKAVLAEAVARCADLW